MDNDIKSLDLTGECPGNGEPATFAALWAGDTRRRPMTDLSRAELFAARELVEAFWAALADDDEQRLLQLCYPPSLVKMYASGRPVSVADDLRSRMGVTIEDCKAMGITASARILPDGSGGDAVAFVSVRTLGFVIHYEQPTQVRANIPVAYRRRPSEPWMFWGGITQEELDTAEYVDLRDLPEAGR